MQRVLTVLSTWFCGALAALALLATAAHAADKTVTWDFTVSPAAVSVNNGDTVTWNTTGFGLHPLSEANASFIPTGSSLASSGTTYQRAFASPGTYYFTCINHGNMRLTVTVTAACAPPAITAALDVDGNGQVDAATDGLLILRYLLGIRGSALIAGALGTCPGRGTFQLIEGYLATRVVP